MIAREEKYVSAKLTEGKRVHRRVGRTCFGLIGRRAVRIQKRSSGSVEPEEFPEESSFKSGWRSIIETSAEEDKNRPSKS